MGSAKVLIVEDEGVVAMSMKMVLRTLGYSVIGIAPSGKKALELATKETPDVILMDIQLRGKMDGIETAMKLFELTNKRVIYITAHTDDNTAARAAKTNPIGMIEKPVDADQYKEIIEKALLAV
jgi:DNA-binding NarL/FixJ family response regulator